MEIFWIIIAIITVLIILFDINTYRLYMIRAHKATGTVLEAKGEHLIKSVEKFQVRKYRNYHLSYEADGVVREDDVLLKNTRLNAGDRVEVRYLTDDSGISLLDNVAARISVELTACYIVALLFSIAVIFAKN